jgi:hypothetical protein
MANFPPRLEHTTEAGTARKKAKLKKAASFRKMLIIFQSEIGGEKHVQAIVDPGSGKQG